MRNQTGAQARGAIIGALILTMFGAVWAYAAILNRPVTPASALYLAAIPPIMLLVISVSRFGAVGKIGPAADPEHAAREGRAAGRIFGLVVAIEVVLIAAAAMILGKMGRPLLIPVCIAGIVGAHFLPLAKTFHIPLYALTGWLLILCALGSLLVADEAFRDFVLGLAVAAVLWVTAGAVLHRHAGSGSDPRGVERGGTP